MAAEESFTRRVCAILLADVSGFSALMGEDDESTARAIGELQQLILGIVAEADGHAEPAAGDAIFATFDSVVAAVRAALGIQERLAEQEFHGQQLRLRIGVHVGDVLLREGAAFGDAINIAARLQTLAKPGTVCISDGVYRHVRNRFDEKFVDLGRQQLKHISDPVHAYLIVPRGAQSGRPSGPSKTRLGVFAAAAAVVLVAVGLFTWQQLGRQPPPPAEDRAGAEEAADLLPQPRQAELPVEKAVVATGPVTLGVMQFKSLGGATDDDWRREALRDGLNTQLSQLSRIKVYSKEFIDFLITRQKLSEIEVANKLGISKMLSGSFVVVGKTLRIETHVVDVATGMLESSYTTSGPEEEFLDLQSKVVFGAIANLDLPVTDDEKRLLLAQQQNTTVEALKLLLEAETGAGAPAEPEAEEKVGPSSALLRWFAWALVAPAFAQEGASDEVAIQGVLEQYRKATEAGEIDQLAMVYLEFTAEQEAAQQRYFENVRDLQVGVENVDIAVVGDEAVVSYTRIDDFTDVRTGRPMHVSVRLTKMLQRADDGWKFAPVN
jgi:class 3 adenylate cyclase/TolB-like protein/ketosteroid isomerase-like protein